MEDGTKDNLDETDETDETDDDTELGRLLRMVGGRSHREGILLSLEQATLLAEELAILEALVDRHVLTADYELLTEHGPESLLDPGRSGL